MGSHGQIFFEAGRRTKEFEKPRSRTGVHILFVIASIITFIFINYDRQFFY